MMIKSDVVVVLNMNNCHCLFSGSGRHQYSAGFSERILLCFRRFCCALSEAFVVPSVFLEGNNKGT
jgi:hypothetical protein